MKVENLSPEVKQALSTGFLVNQAAIYAGANHNTVLMHCLKGSLPAVKLGNGSFLILEEDLKEWMGVRPRLS